ncbi:hypothetical protein HPB48_010257 [Haemaphysalis longicornis]|uniref:Uncharacterized protein n=1 Tax=Haemaphysalis longicornis TaxID=44386 RepID=A0A9J6GN64_HAELO|nr:hypothetical protein HPB48_010257 [Haemaphysalis longicornis]
MAMADRSEPNSVGVSCLGNTMPFEVLLDYLAHFTRTMKDRTFFTYAWFTDITHDVFKNAGYADAPFHRLLLWLLDTGVLNRTVLVFLRDLGFRMGGVRSTFMGKLEDRQPFAFIAFPPRFLRAHPEAASSLRVNQWRLTTHFDVHATLVELLDYPRRESLNTTHGLSLLHQVPETRTCADASIGKSFCVCNVIPYAVKQTLAASLTNYLLSTINTLVQQATRHCSQYRRLEIIDVMSLQPTAAERARNVSHYSVTVKVSPGEVVFEGAARVQGNEISEVGDVSRCDEYSRLSYSVHTRWLRRACHCRRTVWDVA